MNPIIVFLSSIIFLLWLSRRRSYYTKYLILIYLSSVVASTVMTFFYTDSASVSYTPTYTPLILLFPFLLIWFFAFADAPSAHLNFNFAPFKYYQLVTIIAWFFLPFAIWVLYNAYSVLTVVDFGAYRTEADYVHYIRGTHLFLLASWVAPFFYVPQLLLFVSIRKEFRISNVYRALLLFDSLIYVFYCFFYAGRDGILFWMMDAFLMYFMFRGDYDKSSKRKIEVSMGIISLFGLVIFAAITLSRFVGGAIESGEDSADVLYSLIFYLGQQPFVYCQTFIEEFIGHVNTTMELEKCFGYFVNDFFLHWGVIGATIVTIFSYFIIKQNVRHFKRTYSLWSFLIVFTFYQVPLYGVFYYRQVLGDTQIVYILFILLCYILSPSAKRGAVLTV